MAYRQMIGRLTFGAKVEGGYALLLDLVMIERTPYSNAISKAKEKKDQQSAN